MIIQKDKFDTQIFKKDVYKISLTQDDDAKLILNKISEIKNGLLVCFSPVKYSQVRILEDLQFKLINIRSIFKLKSKSEELIKFPRGIIFTKYNKELISDMQINDIANTISLETRYGKDILISEQIRLEIYTEWIKNSLYTEYSSGVFLAWNNEKPIGICSTKVKDQRSEIDLFCVLPEFQNQKVGQTLLSHAVSYLEAIQNKPIYVVTSGENIAACKLFEKFGFCIDKVELVYHLHL